MSSNESYILPTATLAHRRAPGSANKPTASGDADAYDSTPTSATPPVAPVVAPLMNPQMHCPIFSLAREVRDMIYTYVFTSNLEAQVNGNPPPIKLGTLLTIVPSNVFLQTCRQFEQEATAIYRAAYRSFFNDYTDFSVELSDDWEGEEARNGKYFADFDLLDKNSLFPELSDEETNAMRNLVITVRSDIGSFEAHLGEARLP